MITLNSPNAETIFFVYETDVKLYIHAPPLNLINQMNKFKFIHPPHHRLQHS
jgi:hypothetical protein